MNYQLLLVFGPDMSPQLLPFQLRLPIQHPRMPVHFVYHIVEHKFLGIQRQLLPILCSGRPSACISLGQLSKYSLNFNFNELGSVLSLLSTFVVIFIFWRAFAGR